MNENFLPIEKQESNQNSNGFQKIEQKPTTIQTPPVSTTNEKIINQLPEWNLEPPVEINRGLS